MISRIADSTINSSREDYTNGLSQEDIATFSKEQ